MRWGREHQVAVRADAAWLGDVLARLHQCPELLERLSVVVNDAGSVRGDRFVAPGPAPDGVPQAVAPIEVSVRHSRPVRAALKAAGEPVNFGALRKLLIHQFPAAAAQQIDGLLAGLLDQGMLISSLWAPMTCPDALGHACAELEAADAHTIPQVEGLVRELSAIHQELSTDSPAIVPRSAVTERMRALSEAADAPLVVNTILDCDVQIPEQVAREACDAVRVLYRLSPYPFGYPAWRDYHTRFRARHARERNIPWLRHEVATTECFALVTRPRCTARPGADPRERRHHRRSPCPSQPTLLHADQRKRSLWPLSGVFGSYPRNTLDTQQVDRARP